MTDVSLIRSHDIDGATMLHQDDVVAWLLDVAEVQEAKDPTDPSQILAAEVLRFNAQRLLAAPVYERTP